jgi:hypothetical protein
MDRQSAEAVARPIFGRRSVVPSVCIVEAKQHIRAFLGTALEEFGFIVCECSKGRRARGGSRREAPRPCVDRLIRWLDRDPRNDQDARN